MPRRLRTIAASGALLVGASLILSACGTSSASSNSTTTEPTTTTLSPEVRAFYDPPNPLPEGPPGTIIRTLPMDAPAGAQAWRVLYLSRSVSNAPIAVSGIIYAPAGAAPSGGRPVVSWAHETTGIADDCAPSHQNEATLSRSDLVAFLKQGYVVAATDYEGLGTPGVHPYLVGKSEAHSVLDAARAATKFPPAGAGTRVALYGYSQGGHSTLFAAQEAAAYAPELTIVGSAATAPPADLSQVGASLVSDRQLYGFGVLAAFGLNAAYPDQVPLNRILAQKIIDQADVVERTCEAFAFFALALQPFDKVFNPAVVNDVVVNSLLAENSAGANAPEGPVIIFSGGKDTLATPAMIEAYLKRVCPLGANVEVVTKADRDHGGIARDDFVIVQPWIADRFAGKPVTPGCPVRR